MFKYAVHLIQILVLEKTYFIDDSNCVFSPFLTLSILRHSRPSLLKAARDLHISKSADYLSIYAI